MYKVFNLLIICIILCFSVKELCFHNKIVFIQEMDGNR